MSGSDSLADRLTNLELLFTHLERQVGELHQALLRQQRQIEAAEAKIRRLETSWDAADNDPADEELP